MEGNEKLIVACEKNDFSLVKELVSKGININERNRNNTTAPYVACFNKNFHIVKYLVEKGADLEEGFLNGDTLLHVACMKGDLDIVRHLVEHGAKVSSENDFEETPIYYLCKDNKLDAVKYLVEKGANINIKNKENKTPLYIADKAGSTDVMRYLIEEGAYDSEVDIKRVFGCTELQKECWHGDLDKVKNLLAKGKDINEKDNMGNDALWYACCKKDSKMIELLMDRGIYLDMDRCTQMLKIASDNKDEGLFEKVANKSKEFAQDAKKSKIRSVISNLKSMLVAMSSKFKEHTKYFLLKLKRILIHRFGFSFKDKNEKKVLLPDKENIDEKNETEENKEKFYKLCEASKLGDLDRVNNLIKQGVNVKAEDKEGNTVLMYACDGGNIGVVEALLDSGADINKSNEDDCAPIHVALGKRNRKLADYLISRGADIDIQDEDGYTPLYYACANDDRGLIKYLVEHKADVNKKAFDDTTPLHAACYNGSLGVVKYLIKNGADIETTIDDEKVSLSLNVACERSFVRIVEELLKNGVENINAEDERGYTPLLCAYEGEGRQQVPTISELLSNGADIDYKYTCGSPYVDGDTLLHMACRESKYSLAKYFIKHGADTNIYNESLDTPLYIVYNENINSYRVEFNKSKKNSSEVRSIELRKEAVDLAKFLIKFGAYDKRVNIQQICECNSLQKECWLGNIDKVKSMIEKGFNINEKDNDGNTALDYACWKRDLNMMKLLMEKGIEISAKDCFHMLEVAALNRDKKLFEELLELLRKQSKESKDILLGVLEEMHASRSKLQLMDSEFRSDINELKVELKMRRDMEEVIELGAKQSSLLLRRVALIKDKKIFKVGLDFLKEHAERSEDILNELLKGIDRIEILLEDSEIKKAINNFRYELQNIVKGGRAKVQDIENVSKEDKRKIRGDEITHQD